MISSAGMLWPKDIYIMPFELSDAGQLIWLVASIHRDENPKKCVVESGVIGCSLSCLHSRWFVLVDGTLSLIRSQTLFLHDFLSRSVEIPDF